jgi:tetratricopeptide (TPR) repeat protein
MVLKTKNWCMMKKHISIAILTVFVLAELSAHDSIFAKANTLYADGQFELAALHYEQLLDEEGFAPQLYYNLGNAYFKSNELGKAILNYERALRFTPDFPDAQHNLDFANLKVIDNLTVNDAFFLKKWMNLLLKLQQPNGWFLFGGIAFIVAMVSLLLFFFGKTVVMRKFFFYIALISIVVSFTTLIFSGIRKKQVLSQNEAIILSGVVVVKSAPDRSGTNLYQLHEGTKVTVISELGEWYEVRPGDGTVGWIEIIHLERI